MALEISVRELIETNDWTKTQVVIGNGGDRKDLSYSRRNAVVFAINHAAVDTPCDFAVTTEDHLSKNLGYWSLYQPYVLIKDDDIKKYCLTPGGTVSLLASILIPRAWRTCFSGLPMDDRPEKDYAYQVDALNEIFVENKDKRIVQTTGNPSLLIPIIGDKDPIISRRVKGVPR